MILKPNCFSRNCKWYVGVYQSDGTEMTEVNHCMAFPEGIPDEIAYGNNKHSKLYPGQVGKFLFKKEAA